MRVRRLHLVEHSTIRERRSFLCAPQLPYSRSVSLAASLSLHGVAYFFLNSHLPSLARVHPVWSLERDKGAHPLPTPLRVLHFPLTAALTGLKPKLNDFRRNSLLYGLKVNIRLSPAIAAVAASGQQGVQWRQAAKTCSSELQNSKIIT